MKPSYQKGTICFIKDDPEHPPLGSETWAGRMGVIVSNNINNKYSNVVLVSFITTKQKKERPTHVPIRNNGKKVFVQCEQIVTADKQRLCSFSGTVTPEELKQIDEALLFTLEITNSTRPNGIFSKWEHYIQKYFKTLTPQESEITAQTAELKREIESLIRERNLYKDAYDAKAKQYSRLQTKFNQANRKGKVS